MFASCGRSELSVRRAFASVSLAGLASLPVHKDPRIARPAFSESKAPVCKVGTLRERFGLLPSHSTEPF
jgi:hypothetical protein